jgi:Arc/MetJ family transcription regulator
VRIASAALVRDVVRALSNPEQEQAVRKLLREYFGTKPTRGLKDLPLEGIELKRDRDFGRDVDL